MISTTRRPDTYPPAAAPRRGVTSDFLYIAYVVALLAPPIGFVLGIIVAAKDRLGHGTGLMVLSHVATAVWLMALVVLAPDTTTTTTDPFSGGKNFFGP
jgi:hypothetical protein